jgi:hypothetical protein
MAVGGAGGAVMVEVAAGDWVAVDPTVGVAVGFAVRDGVGVTVGVAVGVAVPVRVGEAVAPGRTVFVTASCGRDANV